MALQGTDSPRRMSPRRPKPYDARAPGPPGFSSLRNLGTPGDGADGLPIKLWEASTGSPKHRSPQSDTPTYGTAPTASQRCTQGLTDVPFNEQYLNFMASSFNPASAFLPPPSSSAAFNALPPSFRYGGGSSAPAASLQVGCLDGFRAVSGDPFVDMAYNVPPLRQPDYLHPLSWQAGAGALPFSIPNFCSGDPTLPDVSQATATIQSALAGGIIWGFPPHNGAQGLGRTGGMDDTLSCVRGGTTTCAADTGRLQLHPHHPESGTRPDANPLAAATSGSLPDSMLAEGFDCPAVSSSFLAAAMRMPPPSTATAILAPPSLPKNRSKRAVKARFLRHRASSAAFCLDACPSVKKIADVP